MKILYDHQTFSLQEYGGISRIYAELLRHDDTEVQTELSLLLSNNAYLKELNNFHPIPFLPKSKWKYKVQCIYNTNQLYSIYKIRSGNYSVFHPSYYDPYFLQHLKGKPFVVTVLDMIHEKLAYRYQDYALDKKVAGKKLLLQEATKVIAISNSTKNDIVEIFGTDRNKIEVIHLGSSMDSDISKTYKREIDGGYILFIGNRADYKNFNFFIKSIVPLLKLNKELKVLCGGGGSFTDDEKRYIKELNLDDRVIQVPVKTDATLMSLYTNAVCFVFPSLYEGFGIPVLEAFSCRCPSAISNRTSLPEVGGDAVVYFNPEDEQSILNAVTSLVDNNTVRSELIKKGLERLHLFSWNKTREETFNLYGALA